MTQDNNTFCGLSRGPVPAEITIPRFTSMAISPLAEYAGAIWKGSPNYWGGRGKEQVISICDHIMAGSIEAANSWFHNSDAEASAHFGVGKLGQVYQWVSIWDSAWANGIMNRPNTAIPWIAECANKGINPNLRTVSIEHEGQPGDKFTDAQYQATLALHRFLISTFKIPVDQQHIIRHADIDSVNRPYCPGPSFPWKDLMADLSQTAPTPNYDKWVANGIEVNDEYGFLSYHRKNGGVAIFGLPLTPARYEPALGLVCQWFERARFENHPDAPQPYRVQLGLLGRELTGIK